ncbi:MAG: hypothetical protein U1F36_20790 [Planctomycetota bacterium]
MSKRAALRVVVPVAIVALLVYGLWPGDERSQVRRLPLAAALAFTEGDLLGCLDLFEPLFVDESGGRRLDRDTIRAGMLGSQRGFAARVDRESVDVIDFDRTAGIARVRFVARLFRLRTGSASVVDGPPEWECSIDARVRRSESGVWRFASAEHVTLTGKPPYR